MNEDFIAFIGFFIGGISELINYIGYNKIALVLLFISFGITMFSFGMKKKNNLIN